MRRISVGQKLYVGVIAVFLVFATTFIVYQQGREKQYKIDALTIRLQDFNDRMDDELHDQPAMTEAALAAYVRRHHMPGLRVTLIRPDGRVVFDNWHKRYTDFANHAGRPEVRQALTAGTGSTVERSSKTLSCSSGV